MVSPIATTALPEYLDEENDALLKQFEASWDPRHALLNDDEMPAFIPGAMLCWARGLCTLSRRNPQSPGRPLFHDG